jgi:hypothetical protein
MENSDGAYPPDSLSNLIGKSLEEVLPGRGDKVLQSAESPQRRWLEQQYKPMTPKYGTNSSREKMIQSWVPWVKSETRNLHFSVRGLCFCTTCETPIRRYDILTSMQVHLRLQSSLPVPEHTQQDGFPLGR